MGWGRAGEERDVRRTDATKEGKPSWSSSVVELIAFCSLVVALMKAKCATVMNEK